MKTLLFIDGDMALNRNKGKPVWISGTRKTAQDVAYSLMTATDELRGIGCGLKNLDNQVQNLGQWPSVSQSVIYNEVKQGVDRLIELQQKDLGMIDSSERILGINQLLVNQPEITSFVFDLSVRIGTEDVLQLAYRVRLGQQFIGNERPGIPGVITDDNRP